MRAALIALVPTLFTGLASAQPIGENPPSWTIQCIEVSGRSVPPVCQAPASRLDAREDICNCSGGGLRVEVDICAMDERPPSENRALDVARREASRDGSLRGDKVGEQRICVPSRLDR